MNISFTNRTNLSLSARVDLPADGTPVAWAIFAHCFTCSKNLSAVGAISSALTEERIGVLRFDFTGLGGSEGEFSQTNFSSNVDDLVDAATWLTENYAAPSILVGHSLGGAAVLQAAKQIGSIDAVATIGAPSEPGHVRHLLEDSTEEIERNGKARVLLGGREFTIRKQFLDDLDEATMERTVRSLGCPLLILHSPVDNTVGIENARQLYEWAKHPKSFVSLDTADHLLNDRADANYAGRVIGTWAGRYVEIPEEMRKVDEAADDNRVVVRTGKQGYRTEILASGHAVVADEPVSLGGTDTGPTPYDLLVSGLGSCTSITLRMYADRKGWPVDEIIVRLRHAKVHMEDGADGNEGSLKIDQIEREIELVGDLDDAQRARLLSMADRCPVHRTLESDIQIVTSLAE